MAIQELLLPPGGWSHPASSFVRITVPLAEPGRVRRRLPGVTPAWTPGLKRQGTISITPPGTEGDWEWLDNSHFGLLFLPQRLLADAIDEAGLTGSMPSLRPAFAEPDDVVGAAFRVMAEQAGGEGRLSRLLVSSASLFISLHLLQRYVAPGAALKHARARLDDARLKRVVDAVEARLGHDWSVEELAREAGLSPHWFAHTFREKVGIAPRLFVQQRRLACARRMLRTGSLSVAQIAAHCGFGNQSWFTTSFKRAFGVTPAAYRRLL